MAENYPNNKLTEVIVRLDFPSPILELNKALPKDLEKIIRNNFPIFDPGEIITQKISFKPSKATETHSEPEWNFFGKERDKRLTLSSKYFFISYRKYESFDILKENFLEVINLLSSSYENIQAIRIGLRYVNTLILQEPNLFEWDEYLNENLTAGLKISTNPEKVLRTIQRIYLEIEDGMILFQYGMPNPDFPAPIREKFFILDYDAFKEGPIDFSDLSKIVVNLHDNIEELFNSNTTDKYKESIS